MKFLKGASEESIVTESALQKREIFITPFDKNFSS